MGSPRPQCSYSVLILFVIPAPQSIFENRGLIPQRIGREVPSDITHRTVRVQRGGSHQSIPARWSCRHVPKQREAKRAVPVPRSLGRPPSEIGTGGVLACRLPDNPLRAPDRSIRGGCAPCESGSRPEELVHLGPLKRRLISNCAPEPGTSSMISGSSRSLSEQPLVDLGCDTIFGDTRAARAVVPFPFDDWRLFEAEPTPGPFYNRLFSRTLPIRVLGRQLATNARTPSRARAELAAPTRDCRTGTTWPLGVLFGPTGLDVVLTDFREPSVIAYVRGRISRPPPSQSASTNFALSWSDIFAPGRIVGERYTAAHAPALSRTDWKEIMTKVWFITRGLPGRGLASNCSEPALDTVTRSLATARPARATGADLGDPPKL